MTRTISASFSVELNDFVEYLKIVKEQNKSQSAPIQEFIRAYILKNRKIKVEKGVKEETEGVKKDEKK